jgi:secondary thiamine-phosphate synthase enzyme
MWAQREIHLDARPRGIHLVTREVLGALPELGEVEVGLLHLLIRHTSASLALNENASPDVRRDFETWFNEVVPEDASYWTHTLEGADDMPAHIKAALLGPTLTLPIAGGRLSTETRAARDRSWPPCGASRAREPASGSPDCDRSCLRDRLRGS